MAEDCDSTDLSTAIKNGYKIIVSTIQKFRYILDETKNNYLMSISYESSSFGVSIADISTGIFKTCHVETPEKLLDEIYKLLKIQ